MEYNSKAQSLDKKAETTKMARRVKKLNKNQTKK